MWTWDPSGTEAGGHALHDKSNLPAQYRTAIVGVLPFDNHSGRDDEYFSDGLTEDLTHALSLQSFYRVLSRNSTFPFKGQNLGAQTCSRSCTVPCRRASRSLAVSTATAASRQ